MTRFDPRIHARNDLEKGWSVDSTQDRFDPRLRPVLIRQPGNILMIIQGITQVLSSLAVVEISPAGYEASVCLAYKWM